MALPYQVNIPHSYGVVDVSGSGWRVVYRPGVRDTLLVEVWWTEAIPVTHPKLLAAFDVLGNVFHACEWHFGFLDLGWVQGSGFRVGVGVRVP